MSQMGLEISDADILAFLEAFKRNSSYDFTNYSMKSLKRRVAKIMSEKRLSINELGSEILKNPSFMEKVVKSITVNTTELFRDPSLWISLRNNVLPELAHKEKLTIWHAGCSTGQEVYSMMIILDDLNMLDKTEIYASDINSDVMEIAKKGTYKYRFNHSYLENFNSVIHDEEKLTPEQRKISVEKYFTVDRVNDSIQMKPFLTAKPVYKKIDLVKDENPFNLAFDLIICRNVVIYFNFDLQNRVFNLFYKNLKNDGCLVLGNHESIYGTYCFHFEKKYQVYYKKLIAL